MKWSSNLITLFIAKPHLIFDLMHMTIFFIQSLPHLIWQNFYFLSITESDHDGIDHGDDYEEVDNYTNHDMVIA